MNTTTPFEAPKAIQTSMNDPTEFNYGGTDGSREIQTSTPSMKFNHGGTAYSRSGYVRSDELDRHGVPHRYHGRGFRTAGTRLRSATARKLRSLQGPDGFREIQTSTPSMKFNHGGTDGFREIQTSTPSMKFNHGGTAYSRSGYVRSDELDRDGVPHRYHGRGFRTASTRLRSATARKLRSLQGSDGFRKI
jgi:hypothetical protein